MKKLSMLFVVVLFTACTSKSEPNSIKEAVNLLGGNVPSKFVRQSSGFYASNNPINQNKSRITPLLLAYAPSGKVEGVVHITEGDESRINALTRFHVYYLERTGWGATSMFQLVDFNALEKNGVFCIWAEEAKEQYYCVSTFMFGTLDSILGMLNNSPSIGTSTQSTDTQSLNTQSTSSQSTGTQNGYKEYTWGMTVSQVRAMTDFLTYEAYIYYEDPSFSDMTRNVLSYLHNSELVSKILIDIPVPLKYESGIITRGSDGDLTFYFINDRLVAVKLKEFVSTNIISDLQRQYGNVNPITYGGDIRTATWNREANRIIYWHSVNPLERVTYIDKNWLIPLVDKAMEEYRKGQSDARSRLD